MYLPVAARLRQLPAATEESARLLGRGPAATFATVVLPQARAAIAAGGLLVFLYVLADFGAVQLLRYDTLTRAIYANRLIDPAVAATLSLALGLLAIVVVLGQRALAPSGRDTRRQGRPLLIVPLGRWRAAAYAYLVALLGLALAAPLAVLAYWASRGAGDGSDRPTSIVANPERLVEPAVNTSLASGAAALVAVVVVLPSPTCRCGTAAVWAARPTPSSPGASPCPGSWWRWPSRSGRSTAPARSARCTRPCPCWSAHTRCTSGRWRWGRPGWR